MRLASILLELLSARRLASDPVLGAGLLSVVLTGCALSQARVVGPAATSEEGPAFDGFTIEEVELGPGGDRTVLTAFLTGGSTADVVAVSRDAEGAPRVALHRRGVEGWSLALERSLPAGTEFVDVVELAGQERLLFGQQGRVGWLALDSGEEHELLSVELRHGPTDPASLPHLDVTHDVNGDGRDDLVIPARVGFWVAIQQASGFAPAVRIGPRVERREYHVDGYRLDPWAHGGVHAMDYDLDGRTDLVFWNGAEFEVHRQGAAGLFTSETRSFSTEVAFDSDELSTLAAPYGIRNRRMDHNPSGAIDGRVLHSLRDHDGDGITDLVVFALTGSSLPKMDSVYEVYFGERSASGTVAFASEIGAVIESDGLTFELGQYDFDRDGALDVLYVTLDPQILKVVGMLLSSLFTDSVPIDLELYRMDGRGLPRRPTARRTIRTYSFGESGERASLFPAILVGDVDGDGREDLLLQHREKELRVYLGTAGPGLFASTPLRVKLPLPKQEYLRLVDLDADGRQDVLVHHASERAPDRVTLLRSARP